jgi:hypothetical protein
MGADKLSADRLSPVRGYGFATSARQQWFYNPDPDWTAEPRQQHKTFAWGLKGGRGVKCLHLFLSDKVQYELEAEIEKAWREIISEPLTARPQGQAITNPSRRSK